MPVPVCWPRHSEASPRHLARRHLLNARPSVLASWPTGTMLGAFGRLGFVDVPVEEDAEGLVGVVVKEVVGVGRPGVGEVVGGHAVGVDSAGFEEGEGASGGAGVPLAAEVAADDAAALDGVGTEGQVLMLVLADEVERAAIGEHVHALLEGGGAGGSADGVDDEVRANAVADLSDGRHRVFIGGVDDVVGP